MACCPYKQDYWSSDHRFWPLHPVVQSMTQDCYKYVWKNISFVKVEELDEEREIDKESDSDKYSDGKEEEEEDKEEEEEEPTARTVDEASWYNKVAPLMDKVLQVSRALCKHPGTKLSINEMMKLFKGRSAQTHQMKKKPIKEGYKFFALCNQETGFVFDFFPDGRLENLRIIDLVQDLVNLLPEQDNKYYFIGMDNFFTTEKVMQFLTEKQIGFVGTARN